MMTLRILPIVFALACLPLFAQQGTRPLTGVVVDSATGEPINGASVRAEGSTTGAYTRGGGRFRLPLPVTTTRLRVRSVGYREIVVSVDTSEGGMRILLPSSGLTLTGVKVVGDITPEEIIRRAIERKDENARRITTIESTTYSKLKAEVDVGGTRRDETGLPEEGIITETFSKIYDQRQPEKKKHIRILQRRQTANISAQDNLAVFDSFFDFMQDEVRILSTRLVTPLGEDALDEYTFRLLGKRALGDQMVYELAFEPKSRVFPGFEGTLTIVEGTYHVIAAKFAPSQETAFPFIKNLQFEQNYDRVNDSIWAPTYQQVRGSARVVVMLGIAEINLEVSAQTNVTDVRVNMPIADSLLNPPDTTEKSRTSADVGGARVRMRSGSSTVTVDDQADSARSEYWDQYAFAEASEEERKIYAQQDSIKKAGRDDEEPSAFGVSSAGIFSVDLGGVGVGINPFVDRSTFTRFVYGGTLAVTLPKTRVEATAGFGSEGTQVGRVEANVDLYREGRTRIRVNGSVESSIAAIQQYQVLVRALEFLNPGYLIYPDYYDFYRVDGWTLGASARLQDVTLEASASTQHHIMMPLLEQPSRGAVAIDPGTYQMVKLGVGVFEQSGGGFFGGSSEPVRGRADAFVGREQISGREFWGVRANIDATIPTFRTGYTPMELRFNLQGGLQATTTPVQQRFVVMRRFPVLGSATNMMTVPINAFAGTEYASAIAEHSFSDIWWRVIGLPTFSNGRGVELVGRFAALSTTQRATPVVAGSVFDSTPGVYMEAGFGIARVPSFVSDLLMLRFDAMWPVGPQAMRGSFGWTISVSGPLF